MVMVVVSSPVLNLSKQAPAQSAIDTNNPIKVLENKGLLNISKDSSKFRDCCSEVDVSFYAEESHRGETVKVFTSNHRFKNGNIVYSSTQELIPDLQDGHMLVKWRETKSTVHQPIIKNTKSDLLHNRSTKKKIIDILQDVEKQKIIQRYESAKKKRHRCCKSTSSTRDAPEIRDKGCGRFLHTLRTSNIRKISSPCSAKSSPDKYLDLTACKHSLPKVSPKQSAFIKSCSEISITSKESWNSALENIVKQSSRHVKYQNISTPSPKRKIKKDLFVIPRHTCHKVYPQELRKKTIQSPEFECYMHHQRTSDHECKPCHRVSQRSKLHHSELDYKTVESSPRQKTVVVTHRCRDGMSSSREKPCQSSHSHKYQKFSRVPQEEVKRSAAGNPRDTHGRIHQRQKKEDAYCKYDQKRQAQKSCGMKHRNNKTHSQIHDTHRKLKHGIRVDLPSEEPFGHIDTHSRSDYSPGVLSFSSSTDSECREGMTKHCKNSSDSHTSICSFYYSVKHPSKHRTKTRYEHHHEDKKRYGKHYHNETFTKSETKQEIKKPEGGKKIKQREVVKEQHGKNEKLIDSNKLVHFKDTKKCLNQRCPEGQSELNIVENVVNKDALREYREHFASSAHRFKREDDARKDREFGQYQLDIEVSKISSSYQDEECDACRIERLLNED